MSTVSNNHVEEVADSLLTKVKEIGYTWNCKKNVKKLSSEKNKLMDMTERVEQKVILAIDKGDEIRAGAETWVRDALAHVSTAEEFIQEEFIQEEAISKKTCFNLRMCVNLDTLHRYGKKAKNKLSSLEQHLKDGADFERQIFIPTPTPGLLGIYPRESINELDTYNSLLQKITRYVIDESVQITGIYGIGGVGKTTLATEVAARVKYHFSHVVFVTLSQTVDKTSIKTQVEFVANQIHARRKVLIILDDVWTELKLSEVGIPCGVAFPSCNILLTSMQRSVCRDMNAQRIICVKNMSKRDGWALFKRVIGERVEIDTKLKQAAMKVVEGCGGLPLILQAVGKALKDEDNFKEWRRALHSIKKYLTLDIHQAIRVEFAHLKLSYDYLESEEAKSIFLLCSLFPQGFQIPLERLAYYGVGLQVFKDLDSVEDARNKVRDAVKILKSSFLLLDGEDGFKTKMHDVVHEVALLIASSDDNKFLVEAGKHLIEWEPRIGSLERYTGISLMDNNIRALQVGSELRIPLLKIFVSQNNCQLDISHESSLALKEAKVIDLENNNVTSLPKSLNQLTRLRMLNLGGNRYLHDVSILGELKYIEILILNGTGIRKIHQEIGNLVNLRLFHVTPWCGLSHIAPGVLSKLRCLEELHIGYYPVVDWNHNSLMEIDGLSKLTILNLYVPHIYLIPMGDYLKRLKFFSIQIHSSDQSKSGDIYRKNYLRDSIQGDRTFFLKMLHLDISYLMQVKRLIEVIDYVYLESIQTVDSIMPMMYCESFGLKTIFVYNCTHLLCLVDSRVLDEMQTFHPSKDLEGVKENKRFLSEVEHLDLYYLSSLKVIWNCPSQYISLNNLVTLKISNCPKLEKLFTVSAAQGLVRLQKLTISQCESLKEVIWDGDEETSTDEIDMVAERTTNILFPCLANISLIQLYNLRCFYPRIAIIKYPLLVNVEIKYCDKMEQWGNGTHDTPNLQFVTIYHTKFYGSSIDAALLATHREMEIRDEEIREKEREELRWSWSF